MQTSPTCPLLSISIPTYNRAAFLDRLLTGLHQQAIGDGRVEITVSDNASTDGTPAVVDKFQSLGMRLRYIRNERNVGGDENIRRCYELSRGRYVWVFGDDDVIAPGGLRTVLSLLEADSYDLIFLAPYHYAVKDECDTNPTHRYWPDAFNVTTDPLRFVDLVDTHSDLMFITSVILNRHRASEVVTPDLSPYVINNIIQLAWILPVLKNLRKGLFVDAQLIGESFRNAAGGYDATVYYGTRFCDALNSWLAADSPLSRHLINNHLTMWVYPWMEWLGNNDKISARDKIEVADPHKNLVPVYGKNPRYWMCVWPLIALPINLARVWAFPWLVRRKLLRLWYQTITASVKIG